MANVLARIVLNGIGLLLAARLVPGVSYSGGLAYLLLAGAVIGLINVLVRPLVTLLSLPAVLLTFGLFYLAINGLMFWLAAGLLDGLQVSGCLPAILGGLVLTVFNVIVRAFRRN
jgi:putative membrane protein